MKHFRPYRAARVAAAVARILPHYWMLVARDRFATAKPDGDDWDRAHRVAADEISRLAEDLEGGLIKAAQIGGARADVVPKPFVDELSKFHDAVPPRSFDDLLPIVEADLGRPASEVFESIDPLPLGSASLAQVHRARLRDGAEVVVKIQYPEARKIFPLDLAMVRRVAAVVQPMQRTLDLTSLANEVTHFVEMELDFEREAQSSQRLGEILRVRDDVRVPEIYTDLSSDRVIVMEYLDGIKVTNADALRDAGHVLSTVGRQVGRLYGAMIFEYGFFHGDPHPGNILVMPDGKIGLLDFGLCKQLPPGFAPLVAEMIVSALIGDSDAALRAAAALSFDIEELSGDNLRSLMLRLIGDSDAGDNLADVLGGTRIRRIPDDFGLVLRTMLLLNGLSHRLAPGRRLIQGELLQSLAAAVRAAKTGAGGASAEAPLAASG